jgi:hypothetical protein
LRSWPHQWKAEATLIKLPAAETPRVDPGKTYGSCIDASAKREPDQRIMGLRSRWLEAKRLRTRGHATLFLLSRNFHRMSRSGFIR